MRFDSIKIHDLGPFKDVELDIAAISGTLVAVVGENGAGKSTLLELLPGALYRNTPTRGSLVELATSREALLEVRAVNGSPYTLRQTADAISGKGEALILDAAGEPQTSTGKVRDADAWVREHFPPPEVLYSSTFLAQRSGGFFNIAPGQRKAVLLRLLQGGIERLEAYAQRARDNASAARDAAQSARARHADALKAYPSMGVAQTQHYDAEAALQVAQRALALARDELDEAKGYQAQFDRRQEVILLREPIEDRIAAGRQSLDDLGQRVRNNRALLAQEGAINAAVAELAMLDEALREASDTQALAVSAYNVKQERANSAERAALQARLLAKNAAVRLGQATARGADAHVVQRAVEALPGAKRLVEQALSAYTLIEEKIAAAEQQMLSSAETRITGLRGGLTKISEGKRPAADIADRTLTADDALTKAARSAPRALSSLQAKLGQAEAAYNKFVAKHDQLKLTAARAQDLAEATAEEHNARAAEAEAKQASELANSTATDAINLAADARAAVGDANETLRELRNRREVLAPKTARAPQLAIARARLEELEPQLESVRQQLVSDAAALEALPVPEEPLVDLEVVREKLTAAEEAANAARAQLAVCAARLVTAAEGELVVAQRIACVRAADSELENWTRLAADCGRDGIQAYEIDAVLPEINTLANDLLHSCYGSRFSVELRSTRAAADGSKVLEDLEVHVVDTVEGFDGEAWRYSGGQNVFLGEAISLALTMLACRIAGLERPTLVRDESGSTLSDKNARAYITMLRRAAELIGADKILFVTHSRELQALADARIEVRDGTAVVAPGG